MSNDTQVNNGPQGEELTIVQKIVGTFTSPAKTFASVDSRGFSGAIRTNKTQNSSLLNLKVQIVYSSFEQKFLDNLRMSIDCI